jgi:D-alanyl-D-alanine carboxypeptidase
MSFARPIVSTLAAAACFVSTGALAQSLTAQQTAAIDKLVTNTLAQTGVPSASVAVVKDGKLVFTRAYGTQSPTIKQARTDVPYRIASISKQFTAAAILLLQDEGKLSLDDPIGKYVPGITDGDHITIRQILSHTAGIQDYWPQDYSFAAMNTPTTPQQIIDRWAKKPLDFTPGSKWQYSNTGYVIAGMIVEKVAGEPLLDFLKQHIFGPLDMHPVNQDDAVGPNYAVGYNRYALGPVRVEKQPAPGWFFAMGELAMTPSDLAKWDIARMNREVLPTTDWKTQETPIILTDGTNSHYGLGVDVGTTDAGHLEVEHSGEAAGFLTENIVFPDDKAAVIVFTNSDFSNAFTHIADGIEQTVFPDIVGQPATDEAAATAQAKQIFDELRTGNLDRSKLTEDANYYFTPTALGDYRTSLAKLGTPTAFESNGAPKLRGGFVYRGYTVTYPTQKLTVSTYREPGSNGKFEQFLVSPKS